MPVNGALLPVLLQAVYINHYYQITLVAFFM
jgi:hypothetical protein